MVHLLKDIEILESALIVINEGASDEKYAALYSLEKLLLEKKDMVAEFEAEHMQPYLSFLARVFLNYKLPHILHHLRLH